MPRGSAHGKLTAWVEPTRPSAVAVGGRSAVRQAAARVAHGPVALLDKHDSACEDAQNRPIGALIAAKSQSPAELILRASASLVIYRQAHKYTGAQRPLFGRCVSHQNQAAVTLRDP